MNPANVARMLSVIPKLVSVFATAILRIFHIAVFQAATLMGNVSIESVSALERGNIRSVKRPALMIVKRKNSALK